jgi:hypothetical protein
MRYALLLLFFLPHVAAGQQVYSAGIGTGFAKISDEREAQETTTAVLFVSFGTGRFVFSLEGEGYTAEYLIVEETPADPPLPGYYWDSSVDRCRSRDTGRFAPSSYCGSPGFTSEYTDFEGRDVFAIRAEGVLKLAQQDGPSAPRLTIGPGFRFGSDVQTFFGTAGILFPVYTYESGLAIEVWGRSSVGSGYATGQLGLSVTLWR